MAGEQMLASNEDTEVRFAEAQDGEMEVMELENDEIPVEEAPKEEKISLTAAEYEALKKGQDSTAALSGSFKELAESLKPRPVAAQYPTEPQLSSEQLEQMMFTPGKAGEAIGLVTQRAINQANAQTIPILQQQNKKILQLDSATGALYTRFSGDIENLVNSLPPNLRMLPNVYELAYEQVIKTKQEVILEEKAQARAEEILKERGLTPQAKTKSAVYSEGAPRAATPEVTAKKGVIYLTRSERDDMVASGMDPKDVMQVKSYIEATRKGKR